VVNSGAPEGWAIPAPPAKQGSYWTNGSYLLCWSHHFESFMVATMTWLIAIYRIYVSQLLLRNHLTYLNQSIFGKASTKLVILVSNWNQRRLSLFDEKFQIWLIANINLELWCLAPLFNNISVVSWWSVLLVEETGVPGEDHLLVVSHWQTLSLKVVSSTPRHEWDSNLGVVVDVVVWQLTVQSVPITTKVVSLNPTHGEVYSIQL
jgi:hypothetical protein